jgi:hypothetical protein
MGRTLWRSVATNLLMKHLQHIHSLQLNVTATATCFGLICICKLQKEKYMKLHGLYESSYSYSLYIQPNMAWRVDSKYVAFVCTFNISWSSGQSFWLLIMMSRVWFQVLPRGFFLEGEDSHGDHSLGSLIELGYKAPLGTSYSYINHLIGTT